MIEEAIREFRNGTGYDFISNNYWDMTKEELARIALEAICAADNDDAIADELENWL